MESQKISKIFLLKSFREFIEVEEHKYHHLFSSWRLESSLECHSFCTRNERFSTWFRQISMTRAKKKEAAPSPRLAVTPNSLFATRISRRRRRRHLRFTCGVSPASWKLTYSPPTAPKTDEMDFVISLRVFTCRDLRKQCATSEPTDFRVTP